MRVSIICLWLVVLTGCSVTHTTPESLGGAPAQNKQLTGNKHGIKHNPVHQLTQRLANQLFDSLQRYKPNAMIGIGTFTPIDTLELGSVKNTSLEMLGLQLEDGLMTATSHQGFRVVEYKLRQQLMLKPGEDLMLTREVNLLKRKQSFDYFLTGTLTLNNNTVLVNARLVEVENQEVVAAATDLILASEIFGQRQVYLKNGQIYRNNH